MLCQEHAFTLDTNQRTDLFAPGIPVDFMVAQGVRAFERAARMPSHARSFARVPAPGVGQAFLYLMDAIAAG